MIYRAVINTARYVFIYTSLHFTGHRFPSQGKPLGQLEEKETKTDQDLFDRLAGRHKTSERACQVKYSMLHDYIASHTI